MLMNAAVAMAYKGMGWSSQRRRRRNAPQSMPVSPVDWETEPTKSLDPKDMLLGAAGPTSAAEIRAAPIWLLYEGRAIKITLPSSWAIYASYPHQSLWGMGMLQQPGNTQSSNHLFQELPMPCVDATVAVGHHQDTRRGLECLCEGRSAGRLQVGPYVQVLRVGQHAAPDVS